MRRRTTVGWTDSVFGKRSLAVGLVAAVGAGISGVSEASEEVTSSTGLEDISIGSLEEFGEGSDEGYTYSISLSEWIEANGGQAAVDVMLAEEARAEAMRVLGENQNQQSKLRDATQEAIDKCEGTSIGSMPTYGDGGMDFSQADVSFSFSVPFSVFGGLDWDQSQVSVGSRGVGLTTNGAVFWGGPSEIAECINREIQDAASMVAHEVQQLMDGDFSLIEDALIAVAVDYAIGEVSDRIPELGEMLDTLQSMCLSGSMKCF